MTEHFEDTECDGRQDCKLTRFHQSVSSLQTDGTIMGVLVPDKHPETAAGLLSSRTRHHRLDNYGDDLIAHKVKDKVKHLSLSLCKDLRSRVIKDKEVGVIENTQHILDYNRMMKEMKDKDVTPYIYTILTFSRLFDAAKALCVPSLEKFPQAVLQEQYRNYMRKIVMLVTEMQSLDPIKIASRLFSSKEKLYDDIQLVLHIAAYAATKSSCESVVESYISQYENASESRKNFKEESMNDVFEIIRNGPWVSKCDKLLQMSLASLRKEKKKLHFVTRNLFAKSTVIKRIEKESSQLAFMD